jgi:hypothetical protein
MEVKDIVKNDNWKYVAGIFGVGLLYFLIVRPSKKNTEKSSGFLGSPFGQRVMFTLTNTSQTQQVVPLFNAYSNTQNQSVSITPSMSEFNRTLLNEKKLVKMIEIRAMGNQSQAEKVIQVYCKDASGQFKSSNLYPMVSAYQKALDMTSVEPKDLVLDGVCYFNYTLDPSQTVSLTVHYDLASNPKDVQQKNIQKKAEATDVSVSNVEKTSIVPQTKNKSKAGAVIAISSVALIALLASKNN